jgi:hypothetical protein
MSIGLGISRSSRQGVRIGGSGPTVREICLVGVTGRARNEPRKAGLTITWLGRSYQVVATSTRGPAARGGVDDEPAGQIALITYVHLVSHEGA